MFCNNCGKSNNDIDKFCTSCGKVLYREGLENKLVQNNVNEKRYVRPQKENGKKTILIVASVVLGLIVVWGAGFIGYKTFMVKDTDKKQTTIKNSQVKQEDTKSENIKIYEDENKGEVSLKGKGDPNGYIIPDSSIRVLKEEEIRNLSKEDLALVRNEIFARNGYVFKSSVYVEYFKSKTWYVENTAFAGNESDLNEVEKQNVSLIKSLESR